MKLLIDVDKETWEFLKNSKENLWWNRGVIISVINGTPIHDNATNLDVLMAVFPKVTLNEIMCVDNNWAKEPYKKGE